MGVRIVESVFAEKQLCQEVMIPKERSGPIERGCDPDGCLEVFDCLLRLAPDEIYPATGTVIVADRKLIASIREIDRSQCGFFCSVHLFVSVQQHSELLERPCLSWYMVEPLVNLEHFFCL